MEAIKNKLSELGIEPMKGSSFESFSIAQVEQLQLKFDFQLPESYKQFLLTYGRSTFAGLVNCTPDRELLYFGWFYSFQELLAASEDMLDLLPENIIPIGEDGGGNCFCLGVRDLDFDKIFFHHHSVGWHSDAEKYQTRGEEVPKNIRYQVVTKIADSFEQFIFLMKSED